MGAAAFQHGAARAVPGEERGVFGSPARAFVLIFLLSFAVRIALLVVWASSHEEFYNLGGEIGRVALSKE